MGANLRGPAARASPGASPPLRHRDGVAVLGRWKAANTANLIMLAVLLARIDRDRRSLWRGTIDNANLSVGGLPVFDDFFWGERNADWEGRKADSIGIGPVHLGWTIVDGGEKVRVPTNSRRLLRAMRTAPQDEVGTWNIVKVSAHARVVPLSAGAAGAGCPGREHSACRPS